MTDIGYIALSACVWIVLAVSAFLWCVRMLRYEAESPIAPRMAILEKFKDTSRFYSVRRIRTAPVSWKTLAFVVGAALLSRLIVYLVVRVVFPVSDLEICWAGWDAHHYLWIAENGYTADQSLGDGWLYIVFYPLFPFLAGLAGNVFTGAVAVSCLSLCGACTVMYRMALEDGSREEAWWAVMMLLTFPTGIFLGIPYTESLFLLTSSACLWCLRRHRWMIAGIWGMAAALTRNLGLLLTVPYLVEWLLAHHLVGHGWRAGWPEWRTAWKIRIRTALPGFLIFLGMGIYLGINYAVYGDPLKFMEIQKMHWSQELGTVANTFRYTFENASDTGNWGMLLWRPQLMWMTLSMAAMPFAVRKLRPAEGAYTVAYLAAAMSPTWLLSYPRYLMGMATLYPFLVKLFPKRWMRIVWCVVMGVWMLIQAVLFTEGKPIL